MLLKQWTKTCPAAFFAVCAAIFFLSLFPLKLAAATVNHVRFGVQDNKTRVVMEVTENPMQKVSPLMVGQGVVIELKGNWNATVAPAKGMVVSSKHKTIQNGVQRFELYTKTPIVLDRHFFLKGENGQAGRLVFDFKHTAKHASGVVPTTATTPVPAQKDTSALDQLVADTVAPIPPKLPKKQMATQKKTMFQKPVVVIDPGHGGKDSGAIGTGGTYEKHLVLKMSRELRDAINRTGRYKAVLTRSDDRFIPLGDRVKIARRHKADLFISVHADSLPKASRHVSGATVYTLSETASDKQSARLAARENKAGMIGGVSLMHEDKEVSGILIDLVQRETMNLSAKYANLAIDSLAKRVNVKNHAHRFAGFAVLKGVDTPSILLEMGYLSNSKEEWKMNQASYRRKIAGGLVESIDKFFRQQVALNSGN